MVKRIALSLAFVIALCAARSWALAASPATEPSAAATPKVPAPLNPSLAGEPTQPQETQGSHELMQLDYASAIWTLIIFLILLLILYKGAWKHVLAGLKGREERIRNDLSQAEAARLKAEAALSDYNARLADAQGRAGEILAKATADAQNLAERIRADADKAAQERASRAAREIEDARNEALREIYDQAARLSTSIAEKILRRNLNPDDQRDLVAQSLEKLQAVNRG